jgi:hypothetical protein
VDDDIVWIHLDNMHGFLQYREAHKEHFFVSANVVNNGVCAFHQQGNGASIRAWNLAEGHKEHGKVLVYTRGTTSCSDHSLYTCGR